MITTKGKSVIAKYMLGQAPAYASYIALGCGPKPLDTTDAFGDYSAKTDLDFEMFRVPIISKGYVTEGGASKIVLTAELPTEDRYEISEIGIYSAGSNPAAGAAASKMLFTFSDNEEWEYHSSAGSSIIPTKTSAEISSSNNDITITDKYFRMNSDATFLSDATRVGRYERPRFLNGSIVLRGDTASLYSDSGDGFLEYGLGDHIHLSNISINLDSSSPSDEMRLAFSLLSKESTTSVTAVSDIKILIEFASTEDAGAEWARFNVDLVDNNGESFTTNRYVVAKQKLSEMQKSANFSWNSVSVAKIYVTANAYGSSSDEIYVALDALRIENVAGTDASPLYGLTGYTIVKDPNKNPIVKEPNTSNFIEFRFALDVMVPGA